MKRLLTFFLLFCLVSISSIAFAGANKSYIPSPILNSVTGTTPYPRTGYLIYYTDENEKPTVLFPSGTTAVLGVTPFTLPTSFCGAGEILEDTAGDGVLVCAAQSGSGSSGVTIYAPTGSMTGQENIFVVGDPTSGTSPSITGNTLYISNTNVNQDLTTTGEPQFTGVTSQAFFADVIGEQIITAVNQAIGATGYSTMHISSDADYTLTTTPSIVGGRSGQILFIHNHGGFDIDLQDNSVLTGSSIFIGRSPGTIHSDSTMTLVWSSKVSGFRIYANPNTAVLGATATVEEVRNASGGDLNAGDLVHITGWSVGHNRPEVEKADADDLGKFPAFGFMVATITNNQNGEVIILGEAINLIDTSSASIEDGIWLSTIAGEVVFTRPITDCVQKLGEVARVGTANASAIFVFGAGRCNDTPNEMDDVTGISVYAKPNGASGLSVFGAAGASEFQVDSRGVFAKDPTLDQHVVTKSYGDANYSGGGQDEVESGASGYAAFFNSAVSLFGTPHVTLSGNSVWIGQNTDSSSGTTYFEVGPAGAFWTIGSISGASLTGVTIINPDGSTGVSDWVIFIDEENKLVAIGPASAREALSLVIGTDVQAWDAELDTIAALTETNGNVMFVAGGAWTSDATPAIDCTDCTNVSGSDSGATLYVNDTLVRTGITTFFINASAGENSGVSFSFTSSSAGATLYAGLDWSSAVTPASAVTKWASASLNNPQDWPSGSASSPFKLFPVPTLAFPNGIYVVALGLSGQHDSSLTMDFNFSEWSSGSSVADIGNIETTTNTGDKFDFLPSGSTSIINAGNAIFGHLDNLSGVSTLSFTIGFFPL